MANEASATYGAKIRQRREALGLTAEALAIETGRTSRSVANWESGAVMPPRRVRVLIAAILEAPDLLEAER